MVEKSFIPGGWRSPQITILSASIACGSMYLLVICCCILGYDSHSRRNNVSEVDIFIFLQSVV